MAKQHQVTRQWATKAFNPNGTDTVDLLIGPDCMFITLYLSGLINVTTAYTTMATEGIAKLIKSVQLMFNGETIADLPFTILTHGNFGREGGLIKVNPAVGVAAYNPEVVGFLDLAHIAGMRDKDSALRTGGARQFQLRINWGALTDLYPTGAGACTPVTPALNLSIVPRYVQELDPLAMEPELKRLYKKDERNYGGNTVERLQLDPDFLYRAIVLRTEISGELSAAVLNNVKVELGSEVIFDVPAATIVDLNTQDYDFTLPAGYYVIDFAPCPSGLSKVSDFLDAYGRKDVYMSLDVNGGVGYKVQIVKHQFQWLNDAVARNRQRMAQRAAQAVAHPAH